MSTKWIIYGFLALALLLMMNLVGPCKGTTQSDFPNKLQPIDSNPLPACPDTPNCVRLSVPLDTDSNKAIKACEKFLKEMEAEDIQSDPLSLQIDAVFRISLIGFRDDFSIRMSKNDTGGSILHLSSRSRVGKGDLGVNRRRVRKFLSLLQSLN